MKINANSEYRIDIELSAEDLKELDITYDELDYSNIETRRVLWTVLDCARKSLGRNIDVSGKMLIEARQLTGGGCVLGFTLLSGGGASANNGKLIKRGKSIVIFEPENTDDLLDAAAAFSVLSGGTLYEKNGKYRIILDADSMQGETGIARLREFGEVKTVTNTECASTQEHWQRILAGLSCSGPQAAD